MTSLQELLVALAFAVISAVAVERVSRARRRRIRITIDVRE